MKYYPNPLDRLQCVNLLGINSWYVRLCACVSENDRQVFFFYFYFYIICVPIFTNGAGSVRLSSFLSSFSLESFRLFFFFFYLRKRQKRKDNHTYTEERAREKRIRRELIFQWEGEHSIGRFITNLYRYLVEVNKY